MSLSFPLQLVNLQVNHLLTKQQQEEQTDLASCFDAVSMQLITTAVAVETRMPPLYRSPDS